MADPTTNTSQKAPPKKPVRKFEVVRDDTKTTIIIHGSHGAVTLINEYNPATGNPVIVFGTAPTAEERRHYFEGRSHGHQHGPLAGMIEVVNGNQVPVRIVDEYLFDHDELDDVQSLFVEIAPNPGRLGVKTLPHPPHHLVIGGGNQPGHASVAVHPDFA